MKLEMHHLKTSFSVLKQQKQIKIKTKLTKIVALSEIGEGARRAGVAITK
jgi:hypothetical protein